MNKLYKLEDMRNTWVHRISYFETMNEAESEAVRIMDTMPFKWQRCEYDTSVNTLEYAQAPAIGTCQVIVRVATVRKVKHCKCGNDAIIETRRGCFCNDCYQETYNQALD
jgi:hypothetical protein